MNKNGIAVVLAFTLFATGAQAGIVIGGTRVVYEGNKKETTLSIRNTSPSEANLIQSWLETDVPGMKAPFIVTPPLFRIKASEENLLRIVYTGGALPQDRESVFWLNVKTIPSMDKNKAQTNVLQLVVKSRLKFFYRPAGLEGNPQEAYKQLAVSKSGQVLTLTNPTPWYVSLFTLKVGGQEIKEADLVPPMGSVRFTLPSAAMSSASWQAINDFGGISETERRTL